MTDTCCSCGTPAAIWAMKQHQYLGLEKAVWFIREAMSGGRLWAAESER